MRRFFLSLLMMVVALPAMAENTADWRFGGDAYLAGRSVTLSGEPVNDLFMAGDRITVQSDIAGSAHMAGRYVTLDGRVGDNFYGAGMDVSVGGTVAGNVTVMGESVTVSEPVSGNLRATGANVDITAPVAGSVALSGDHVGLDSEIGGDLAIAGQHIVWGDKARVDGQLQIYADNPDDVVVPESVASADRVTVHGTGDFQHGKHGAEQVSFLSRLRGWIGGVLVVGVLGTIFAAVAPAYLAGLREAALARPWRAGTIGFVGLSALIGSVVLLAMTGIGLVLVPVALLAALLLAIAGYVIGAYVLGVWAVNMSGRGVPASTGGRAMAAFLGAAIGALIGLIPWVGWFAVMAIFLIGAGVFAARILKWDRETA